MHGLCPTVSICKLTKVTKVLCEVNRICRELLLVGGMSKPLPFDCCGLRARLCQHMNIVNFLQQSIVNKLQNGSCTLCNLYIIP